MGEEWRRIHEDMPHRELPHGDWEVYATTPWNYALAVDCTQPERSLTFEQRAMPESPFAPENAPVVAQVHGRRVPEWQKANNSAGAMAGRPRVVHRAPGGADANPLRLHEPAHRGVSGAG